MAKSKVSLTLDADAIEELSRLTNARSMSAAVTSAVAEKLARMRQQRAVDEWVRAWEEGHGRIADEDSEAWEQTWRRLEA